MSLQERKLEGPTAVFEFIHQWALNGYAPAQNDLGDCFRTGYGTSINLKKAAKSFRVSAENNWPEALNNLGMFYRSGIVEEVPQDDQNAFQCFKQAAPRCSRAMANLGECYLRGRGVPQAPEKAFSCFWEAGEDGTALSQFVLGRNFEFGIIVEIDKAKAMDWYRKSAAKGCDQAQQRLGQESYVYPIKRIFESLKFWA